MSEQKNKPNDSLTIPLTEKLKSIPGFFGFHLNEKPEFTVVRKEGEVEIRSYPELTLAQYTAGGSFDSFREEAFKKLAGYIFGKNHAQQKLELDSNVGDLEAPAASGKAFTTSGASEEIAMTSPVLQQHKGRGWTMSFILPKKYTEESAPTPEDAGVTLTTQPARNVAVISYTGNNTEEKMESKLKDLTHWISQQKDLSLVSEPFAAQYDAPFTIPFLKTNEVHAEVRILN